MRNTFKKAITKLTIKTGSGTELSLEGDRDLLRDIANSIYRREESKASFRRLFSAGNNEIIAVSNEEYVDGKKVKKSNSKESTSLRTKPLAQVFSDLIKDGFFNEPKTLHDTQEVLHEKGYNYPSTSLPAYLLRFTRNNILIRTRNNNDLWAYKLGHQSIDKVKGVTQ